MVYYIMVNKRIIIIKDLVMRIWAFLVALAMALRIALTIYVGFVNRPRIYPWCYVLVYFSNVMFNSVYIELIFKVLGV